MQGAAKVGFLVVVFVALLFGAYALLGRSLLAAKTVRIYAEFPDAAGTTVGTKVLLAGVKVGQVSSVTLVSPKLARMAFDLDATTKIPAGSTAVIPASLIGLGENPIEIAPPERLGDRWIQPGDTIPGSHASPLANLLPNAGATMDELTATLHATRKLLEDQDIKHNLKDLLKSTKTTLDTANATMGKFGGLATQTQTLMAQNQGSINKAVTNAALAMQRVREGTDMITQLIKSGKYQQQVATLLETLNKTGEKAQKLVGSLDAFVNDPKLRQPMAAMMSNVEEITNTGKAIANNTAEMTKNGAIVSAKAIELADKAKEVADEAKKVIQQLEGLLGKGGGSKGIGPIGISMDEIHESKPNHWRTDFEATVPLPEGRLHAGLYDAFEGNKINLQLGKPLGLMGEYRYGIYASKPGIGVDYRVAPRTTLRGDLFDINDPRLDVRARFEFGRGLYGWLGMERIFHRNAAAIGIGISK